MKYEVLKPFPGFGYIEGDMLEERDNGYSGDFSNAPIIPFSIVEDNQEYFKQI